MKSCDFITWRLLMVLVITPILWGCLQDFPEETLFDVAPFEKIVDGYNCGLTEVPEVLPEMQPGQKIVFFATARGEILMSSCEEICTVTPEIPEVFLPLAHTSSEGGLVLASEKLSLAKTDKSGVLALEEETTQIASTEVTGDLQTVEETLSQETSSATGDQRIVSTVVETADEIESVGTAEIVTETVLATENIQQGGFMSLSDDDLVAMLEEENIIAGFYDSQDNLLVYESETILTAEEREQIINLLVSKGKLSELVNRNLSATARTGVEIPAVADHASVVSISSVSSTTYFGHEFALTISLANTGNTPIFDALILNGLPENTTFVRFACRASKVSGYIPVYHEFSDQKLIFVKLYRPIAPGETFKITVLLRAAPWPILSP